MKLSPNRSASSFCTIDWSCVTFGIPGVSGFARMSNLSDSIHDGPPVTCLP